MYIFIPYLKVNHRAGDCRKHTSNLGVAYILDKSICLHRSTFMWHRNDLHGLKIYYEKVKKKKKRKLDEEEKQYFTLFEFSHQN